MMECEFLFVDVFYAETNRGIGKIMGFYSNSLQIQTNSQSLLIHPYQSLACYLFNKLFNSIACLLYFHQSATGDTRENLDFAVVRQKPCINIYGHVWLYITSN